MKFVALVFILTSCAGNSSKHYYGVEFNRINEKPNEKDCTLVEITPMEYITINPEALNNGECYVVKRSRGK